ncbi:hypothetical protein BMF94_7049 [Rhodotorula taiwanensis]|uniref:Uncharacterized protein n=1 Tax=Rhodotorula taiwanensis TaxID=741276 RepID=A0A2S5AZJ5_9BASI|nr:hypothetical protein BMF94_7049 [Rhodotorula taiwanensis]
MPTVARTENARIRGLVGVRQPGRRPVATRRARDAALGQARELEGGRDVDQLYVQRPEPREDPQGDSGGLTRPPYLRLSSIHDSPFFFPTSFRIVDCCKIVFRHSSSPGEKDRGRPREIKSKVVVAANRSFPVVLPQITHCRLAEVLTLPVLGPIS